MPDTEGSLQVENVRLFILIVTLGVLANASKIWWGFNSALYIDSSFHKLQLHGTASAQLGERPMGKFEQVCFND